MKYKVGDKIKRIVYIARPDRYPDMKIGKIYTIESIHNRNMIKVVESSGDWKIYNFDLVDSKPYSHLPEYL